VERLFPLERPLLQFKRDLAVRNQITAIPGASLAATYVSLGEIKQQPGHVILLQVVHNRPAIVLNMVHPDLLEPVPEDEL